MGRTRVTWLLPLVRRTNWITRPLAGWLPYFGILSYRGRKTGREYRIPINQFRHGDSFVFFLTYGSEAQWVRNVLATGECRLRTVGREYRLVDPDLFTDPTRRLVPAPVQIIGGLAGVEEFLRLRVAAARDR